MTDERFNWVQACHDCGSIAAAAVRLYAEVEADVETRKTLREERGETAITFRLDGNATDFTVISERVQEYRGARFQVLDRTIVVSDAFTKKILMRATPTLDDEGNCKLKVGVLELEFWQFRRRALHNIFFA